MHLSIICVRLWLEKCIPDLLVLVDIMTQTCHQRTFLLLNVFVTLQMILCRRDQFSFYRCLYRSNELLRKMFAIIRQNSVWLVERYN